jgi:hypothetical protein
MDLKRPEISTHQCTTAAFEICMLIKIPSPLQKRTPFFTCAINLAAIVYLSYWSFISVREEDELVKEHIKLTIGSLKTLSRIMPIANTILGQAKGVAKELFSSRKAMHHLAQGGPDQKEETFQRIVEMPTEGSQTMYHSHRLQNEQQLQQHQHQHANQHIQPQQHAYYTQPADLSHQMLHSPDTLHLVNNVNMANHGVQSQASMAGTQPGMIVMQPNGMPMTLMPDVDLQHTHNHNGNGHHHIHAVSPPLSMSGTSPFSIPGEHNLHVDNDVVGHGSASSMSPLSGISHP